MPLDRFYVPGTFWRICDRTGFKVRSYHTRKEWTGRIVRDQSWEYRHPQDFVTGVRDDQTVPEARPRQVNVFTGVLSTTTTATVGAGENSIPVVSNVRMQVGDRISIMLDTGVVFFATITALNPTLLFNGVGGLAVGQFPGSGPSTNVIVFTPPLPYRVSTGNTVIDTSAVTTVSL